MACACVLWRDGVPLDFLGKTYDESPETSWHTASYLALLQTLTSWRHSLYLTKEFQTNDDLVVKQMNGRMQAKNGHYLPARAQVLAELEGRPRPVFSWVPFSENLAHQLACQVLTSYGVEPWSYHKDKPPFYKVAFTLVDNPYSPTAGHQDRQALWEHVVDKARIERVFFRHPKSDLTFYLGPDLFPQSYKLGWLTVEETNGSVYFDNSCRSTDPNDFVSRINDLIVR